MKNEIGLREMLESDLRALFEHQVDSTYNHMAAFTAKDPSDFTAYAAHWKKVIANPAIHKMTIVLGDRVIGSLACFGPPEEREVTYGLARDLWGRGLATEALGRFLGLVTERPLHARAAKDNAGSIRVLEKCGFKITGYDKFFANARGQEIEETVLELRGA